jgi:hypothetical protein
VYIPEIFVRFALAHFSKVYTETEKSTELAHFPAYRRSFKNLNNIKKSLIVVMLAIDTRLTKLLEKHEQVHIYPPVITAHNTNIGTVP